MTIALFGQFDAPGFAFGQVPPVVQAHVAAVNAHGGVNGHQIKITTCNDQGTQPGATNCAREAISSDAVAVLTPYTRYGDATLPLFQQANMVMVGNTATTVADYTNPYSFPGASVQAQQGGVVTAMLNKGCKTVTFIHWDTPTATLAKPLIAQVVEAAGGTLIDKNEGATGASDYGPVAASISGAGSTCADSFLPAADAVKWILAQKQRDPNFIVGASSAVASVPVLTQLGAAGNNLILSNSYPDVSDLSNSEVAAFHTEMVNQNVPTSDLIPQSLQGWGALKLLLGAIGSVSGPVTRANTTKAMNSITKPATTLFGPYNTTTPNSEAAWARAFTTEVYLYTTMDGKLVPLGTPTNQRPLFNP